MQTRQRAAAYLCCPLAGYFLGSCCLRKRGLVVYLIMLWHIPIFQQPLSPMLSFHFRTDQYMIPVDLFTSRFIFFSAHSPQSFQSRYSYHSVSIFLNPDDPVPIPRQGHRIIPIIGNQPDLVADDSFCHFGSSPQTFIDFIFYSVGSVSAVTASPSSFALRRSLPHSGVKK